MYVLVSAESAHREKCAVKNKLEKKPNETSRNSIWLHRLKMCFN